MDSLRIEMRSLIKLKDYLTRNQRLVPYFQENDKTPSWDGEIIVYNSDSIDKEDIEGKVPVQIKGSVKGNLSPKTIKYKLDRSDIRNYLSSNGVIVFVVYMKDYDECKIYYNALLPFDLTRIIQKIGKQKSKTIELKEFPKDDQVEAVNIFLNFIMNQKLQGGTVDQRVLSLDNVGKLGLLIDGFHLGYTGIGLNYITDVINYSLKHPTYIYVQPKGFNIKVPVDKIIAEQILSDIPSSITVDGEVLYDSYKVVHEIDKQVLLIGNCFTFNINTEKMDYKISGILSERITDVKFLIALICNQKIIINGFLLPQRISDDSAESFIKYLKELEEIKSTLDVLGIKEQLEMDELSKEESNSLVLLVRAILYNESVPLSVNDMPGIGHLTIGNLVISLFCIKSGEGNYKLYNFFGNFGGHELCFKLKDDNNVILSPYIQLKKEAFQTISNINYTKIIESILNAPKSKAQDEFANQLVLEMLKAYDEQIEKNPELLQSAHKIIEWLSEQPMFDSVILNLNKLQIIKRKRALLSNELQELFEIRQNTTDEAILTGVNILLESFVEAKLHYDRLSEGRRKEFETYPIANLWTGHI